jgi:hypothetical protein
MMAWKPAKALGLIVGLIIALTIIGVDVFLVRSMNGKDIDLNLYVMALLFVLSIPLLVLWAYWYYGLLTLRYALDRNALVITCGFSQHIVPMEAIERIVPGSDVTVTEGLRGFGWPGYIMGYMRLQGLGQLMVYSTEPLERQLVVVTNSVCYSISPRDTQQFLADFAARRALEPIRAVQQTVEYAPVAVLPVWRDKWFWGTVIMVFLANIVLFALVSKVYKNLPERIPLHFDVQGGVNRVAAKSGLLVIPGIGALVFVVNGLLGLLLHRRERLATYLLTGMALAVQVVLWLATMSALNR